MTGGGPVGASTNLAFGFVGLLMLDYTFFEWQLTPPWWMQLRVLLTLVVELCLLITVFY